MPSYKPGVEGSRVFLKFEMLDRRCPVDGSALVYSHQSSGRRIFRLAGPVDVTSQTVYCVRGRCPLHRAVLHPAAELALAPRGSRLGNDVIGWIGQMRFGRKVKRADIRERLSEEFGLQISETTIQSAADLYAALVELSNLEDPELIAELKRNRTVVLSADAAKPIRGDDAVWFLRDVLSGRTLGAQLLSSSCIGDLKSWLTPVKRFLERQEIPVAGIIIDAEANLQAAMAETFPSAPIQLCLLHYISNLAKPVGEHDRKLRKQLQEGLKGVAPMARETLRKRGVAEGISTKQSRVLGELFRGLQSVLKDNGKPPYKPGGLRMYDRLLEARGAVQAMRRTHPNGVLRDLDELLGVVERARHQAEWIRELYEAVWEMSQTFFSDNVTTASVRRQFREQRDIWEKKVIRFERLNPEHPALQILQSWGTTTENYGERLFTTYAHPHVPRTNNGMEQTISSLKQLARTLSGRPNPAVRFKRQAATLALFHKRKKLPGEAFIATRRKRDFELARRLLAARRRERTVEYRARSDFTGLLAQIQRDFKASEPPH